MVQYDLKIARCLHLAAKYSTADRSGILVTSLKQLSSFFTTRPTVIPGQSCVTVRLFHRHQSHDVINRRIYLLLVQLASVPLQWK